MASKPERKPKFLKTQERGVGGSGKGEEGGPLEKAGLRIVAQ